METVKGAFDIELGIDVATKETIVLTEQARQMHQMILGPSGSGTYSVLHQIKQDLKSISRGGKAGLVILDRRDYMFKVILKECEDLGLQTVNILDLTQPIPYLNINPFKGPARVVAVNFKEILSNVIGDQDEYFKGSQEKFVFHCIMLGKTRFGRHFDLHKMLRMMSEARYLAVIVDEVRRYVDEFSEEQPAIKDVTSIIDYFNNEVLHYEWTDSANPLERFPVSYPKGHKYEGMQVIENRKEKYISGIRRCLSDILSNPKFAPCLVPAEGALDLDMFLGSFLKEGGVLLVNTGESNESRFMGQLISHKIQNAVFERTAFMAETPVYLYVNDMWTYLNYGLARLLSLGRSHKVSVVCSIKELRELEHDADDSSLLNTIRNKVIYGGISLSDAQRLSRSMPNLYSEGGSRVAVTPEEFIELDFKHFYVGSVNESLDAVEPRIAFI
ncbi:hypothetical protein [Paenibacillus taichungensis]